MTTYTKILQTYSLEDILEINELTEEDVLGILLEHKYIDLPDPVPVDLDD